MSDLIQETAYTSRPSTAESNQTALRQLRAFSSRIRGDDPTADPAAALGDAFAGVFAAMAITPPTISQPQPDSRRDRVADEVAPVEDTDDDHEAEEQATGHDPQTVSLLGHEVDPVDFAQEITANTVTGDPQTDTLSETPVVEIEQTTVDQANEQTVAVQAVTAPVAQETVPTGHHASTEPPSPEIQRETKAVTTASANSPLTAPPTTVPTTGTAELATAPTTQETNASAQEAFTGEAATDSSEDQEEPQDRHQNKGDQDSVATSSRSAGSQSSRPPQSPSQETLAALPDGLSATTSGSPSPPATSASSAAIAAAAASAVTSQPTSAAGGASAGSRSGVSGQGQPRVTGLQPAGPANQAASGNPAKTSETSTSKADTLTRIKLVQRVSRAFQHLGSEGGVVRLRLAPAELGTVRVEMRIQNKKVEARVVAETEAASSALREHLPDLRARLEAHGMQVESLEIETESGDGSSSSLNHRSQDDAQRQPESQRGQPSRQNKSTGKPNAIAPPVSHTDVSLVAHSGVDIRF